MVGEELERSVCLGVTVFDATQGLRVAVGGLTMVFLGTVTLLINSCNRASASDRFLSCVL